MKPTRICNWPPRLDVSLRASLLACRHLRRHATRPGRLHAVMHAVARRRWPGRVARQRRFEHVFRSGAA
ncbi:MAG TPA: hypothetical protein VGI14_17615 [Casimicrobiaceae bacterium]|jgi:hypothetical protein